MKIKYEIIDKWLAGEITSLELLECYGVNNASLSPMIGEHKILFNVLRSIHFNHYKDTDYFKYPHPDAHSALSFAYFLFDSNLKFLANK